jgi:hypothetical protein
MAERSERARQETFIRFTVVVDRERTVSARLYPAAPQGRLHATLLLGHGAGADQGSFFMVEFARSLSARGIDTVTFNFPYTEERRRIPDRQAVLEAAYRAALAAAEGRAEVKGNLVFIGGKSLGGRIASHVAAQADALPVQVAGLVFLGYPLHPPGRPDERRDRHLPGIERPMLFVQGERDAFGTADELRPLVARLPGAELHVVAGGNHSLEVPKRAPVGQEKVFEAVQDHVAAWIKNRLSSG